MTGRENAFDGIIEGLFAGLFGLLKIYLIPHLAEHGRYGDPSSHGRITLSRLARLAGDICISVVFLDLHG